MTTIKPTEIPTSLNGYPVKAFSIHPNGESALVLCLREGQRDAWVAASWWPELDTTWQWGNYFASYQEADEYRGRWIRTKQADHAAAQQEASQLAAEGRKAERQGQPVIYIHGKPYADPAHEQEAGQ